MYTLKLQHFPNNELRLTAYSSPTRRFSYEDENENHSHSLAALSPPEKNPSSSLTLPAISELPLKSGFGGLPGATRFGLRGQRTILRAGGAIDKSGVSADECLFLTGTLPGNTPQSMVAMAQWSGYICDRLKSWLSKFLQDRLEFYVWELQKRGALHLHWCVVVPDEKTREAIKQSFKKEWIKLLENVSKKSEVDMFGRSRGGTWRGCYAVVQAYAQNVRSSVTAYMAKYCTKSVGTSPGVGSCPSRWWSISRPLVALLQSLTTEIEHVSSNINSAKKDREELLSFLESSCTRLYRYVSRYCTAQVIVGYHEAEDFESIHTQLKGNMLVKTTVKNSHGTETQQPPFLVSGFRRLYPLLSAGDRQMHETRDKMQSLYTSGSPVWSRAELRSLCDCLSRFAFVDSELHIAYYGETAPALRTRTIATYAWEMRCQVQELWSQLYGFEGMQYSADSGDAPIEDAPPTTPPIEQLCLDGTSTPHIKKNGKPIKK